MGAGGGPMLAGEGPEGGIPPAAKPVDVIVPVYRDFACTRACIEAVLSSCIRAPFRLVVINDASPEPSLAAWLRERSETASFAYFEHAQNRGFVATVNAAMRLHPDRDVLLLNSDTRVANDWLDRMLAHLAADPHAGTVTPFSNNATICSFPVPNRPNPLPVGWSVAQLDQAFAASHPGRSAELPTGVGFCLLIRRTCLDQTGLFDEQRFGRGYGEENDFCLRAQRLGWRHLLAADVFVEHSGGASFGGDRQALQLAAARTVETLHPGYDALVREFAQRDPLAELRQPVAAAVLSGSLEASCAAGSVVLHVLGFGGGGSERHVRDLARLYEPDGTDVQHFALFLAPSLAVLQDLRTGLLYPLDLAALRSRWAGFLQALGVDVVHWHALTAGTLALADRVRPEGLREVSTLHDVGFADPSAFVRVAARGMEPGVRPVADTDDPQWRGRVLTFLQRMAVVLAPSQYIAERCRVATSGQIVARVCPHPDVAQCGSAGAVDADAIARSCRAAGFVLGQPVVALVGALGEHKGLGHWRRVYAASLNQGPAVNWVLIGYADPELRPTIAPRLAVHGAFFPADLAALLAAYGADAVYFPDGMPESFSYALSDVWKAGWPVAVHDRGALAERVRGFPDGGRVFPAGQSPDDTLSALHEWLCDRDGLDAAREALSRGSGAPNVRSGCCRYVEDIWMLGESERAAEAGLWLELQPLLATHLDDTLFRKELVRLGGEVGGLEERLSAADAAIASLRDLAEQRERWAVELQQLAGQRERWAEKLQEDVDRLQVTVRSLEQERERLAQERWELTRQVEYLRQNPCVRLKSWLGQRWRQLRG